MDAKERKQRFKTLIANFIEERRKEKTKGLTPEKAREVSKKYEYHVWLEDASRRVRRIQVVTHPLKATHSDINIDSATSLYRPPESYVSRNEIGSHNVDIDIRDVSGDAAALGVYKLLKSEVDGAPLLDWFLKDDRDLVAALHSDVAIAQNWAEAFKGIIRSEKKLKSHCLAKQVYWSVSGQPADDEGFHLLQPLFSSSLAHAVHQQINEARQAFYNKAARETCYPVYRNLAYRKLGGTKPQNISQLNSERGGVNYMLASLPPRWDQDRPRNFLRVDSALERFRYYEGVNHLVSALIRFMKHNPEPTMENRQKRERIEQALGGALAAFGLATQQLLEPGWTRSPECQLPLCEQLWLDPERTDLPPRPEHEDADIAFQQAYEWKDWPDQVAHRFGNWLNAILIKENLPVGDAEHAHWAKQAIIDAEWPAPLQRRAHIKISEVANG